MVQARIDVTTQDGVIDCHVFRPNGDGPWPPVLFYMDAFGVRPALASMAERLASHGFVVAIPNLYYRSGSYAPFDSSKVFTEGPERDRFKGMIASISDTKVMRDTASVLEALDRLPFVRPGPTAAVGYCMGGGFALSAAGTFPERVVTAASFHGGGLATDKPDSPHLLAAKMRGRIYVGAAGIDPSFTTEQEARLKRALDDAGVQYMFERYEGARHGFAVTGHPVYEHEASERHWQVLLRQLQAEL
ncbi:MAG TPA: dienelactone hydrolase family protein [Vicinamibacterales bacterium]|nr:dienelactone hydrolase family protein [Vicinamibacterales bacterium]